MSEIDDGIHLHLRYIGFTDKDILALRNMKSLVAENSDIFLDRFYAHLKSFEGTRAFLTDEQVVRRLLEAQRGYLLSLFDAQFNDAYYQHRRTIGHTHFRLGLDFKWYIGAYMLYMDFLVPLSRKHKVDDEEKYLVQGAIRKAILLDMSIVLEAYHEGDKAALDASKAQVMHQEKLAAVGLLASGLAHEIGNPLASIQAICDNMLRKAETDPAVAQKFTRVREQVVRITKIVQQLVNYARPAPPNWQPVDLAELLDSTLAIARLSRSAKMVNVTVELSPELPQVVVIRDQLSQVFLNLFLNAIDAMQSQGGELRIRAEQLPGGKVIVEISDNGCGISPENQKNLFTPFFTTKEVGKGTGLGLHVSDGIIRRHGGEIRVRSEAGVGTVFIIELPRRELNAEGTIRS